MNRPKTATADLTMTKDLSYFLVHNKNGMSWKRMNGPKTAATDLTMTKDFSYLLVHNKMVCPGRDRTDPRLQLQI